MRKKNSKFKTVELLGETIHYIYEDNNRPKFLFIHGFNSSLKFAESIYKMKDRAFDVVAFDMPGSGKSSNNNEITIELFQSITLALIDYLKLKDFYIVAHSLGALSGLKALKERKVKHLFLVAPFHYKVLDFNNSTLPTKVKNGEKIDINIHEIFTKVRNLVDRGKRIAKEMKSIAGIKNPIFQTLVQKQILNPHYIMTEVKKCYDEAPYHFSIIAGEQDTVIPLNSLKALASDKHKVLHVIKDCGHAVFMEYPQEIYDTLAELFQLYEEIIFDSTETISEL